MPYECCSWDMENRGERRGPVEEGGTGSQLRDIRERRGQQAHSRSLESSMSNRQRRVVLNGMHQIPLCQEMNLKHQVQRLLRCDRAAIECGISVGVKNITAALQNSGCYKGGSAPCRSRAAAQRQRNSSGRPVTSKSCLNHWRSSCATLPASSA